MTRSFSYFSMIVLLYFAFVACMVHPLEMRAEICTLLPSTEGNEGLVELTLSANHGVTHLGWTQLAITIAANSQLQNLYLDYNNIGDYGAGELSVALAASSSLEIVDLEGCGVSEKGVEMLLLLLLITPQKCRNLYCLKTMSAWNLLGRSVTV